MVSSLEFDIKNDFAVFRQIIRGALNPAIALKTVTRSTFSLIRNANTFVICSGQTKEEVSYNITKLDLTNYGYHSNNDFEVSIKFNSVKNLFQAVIAPCTVYPLSEDISLPEPPDDKSKFYVYFLADEFERIKIRAEKILGAASSKKETSFIASRNLQLLRKLHHESGVQFNHLCSRADSHVSLSDLFIIYVLNLFIIRSIVFYSKFFKPFLNESTASEDMLRTSFRKKIPRLLNHPWLYIDHPLIYEIINKSNTSSVDSEINPEYQKLNDLNSLKIPEPLLKEILGILPLKNSIKLNGNTNVLVDAFFQMLNKKTESGLQYMNSNSSAISKLLSFFIVDKNNDPLNPNSICTMLKPSNFKKRPHKDNNKKINLF